MADPDPSSDAESGDVPPWQQPGGLRRDCEPHRGLLLVCLGWTSLACAWLTFVLWSPGLIGVPPGAVTWFMARRDLVRMEDGLMDPAGEDETERAKYLGRGSMWVGVTALLLCAPCAWSCLSQSILRSAGFKF